MAFFAMAEEALKAKTAANEVKLGILELPRSVPSNLRVGCLTLPMPASQDLSRDAAAVKEELEEKRVAYIKVASGIGLALQQCLLLVLSSCCCKTFRLQPCRSVQCVAAAP